MSRKEKFDAKYEKPNVTVAEVQMESILMSSGGVEAPAGFDIFADINNGFYLPDKSGWD